MNLRRRWRVLKRQHQIVRHVVTDDEVRAWMQGTDPDRWTPEKVDTMIERVRTERARLERHQ